MDLLLYLLEALNSMSWVLPAAVNATNRRRLQKRPRVKHKNKKSIYASEEVLNMVRKSCLTLPLPPKSQETLAAITEHLITTPGSGSGSGPGSLAGPIGTGALRQSMLSKSVDSSVYSIDQITAHHAQRRTRAKTPVLRIGQLEDSAERAVHQAERLASDYRSVLPTRVSSPLSANASHVSLSSAISGSSSSGCDSVNSHDDQIRRTPGRLRKVKSQASLRNLVQRRTSPLSPGPYRSSVHASDSDGETLVGSEPATPGPRHCSSANVDAAYWNMARSLEKKSQNKRHSIASTISDMPPPLAPHFHGHKKRHSYASTYSSSSRSSPTVPCDGDQAAIALQMAVELLTNELATLLFRNHPIESGDRASELQILLLIEAYEGVQRRILDGTFDPRAAESLVPLLDNWLDVLYALYEKCADESGNGDLNAMNIINPGLLSKSAGDNGGDLHSEWKTEWEPMRAVGVSV